MPSRRLRGMLDGPSRQRLPDSLMTAGSTPGGTCLKPFISLDYPWAFDYPRDAPMVYTKTGPYAFAPGTE